MPNKSASEVFRENLGKLQKVSIPQNGIDPYGPYEVEKLLWKVFTETLTPGGSNTPESDAAYKLYRAYRDEIYEEVSNLRDDESSQWGMWLIRRGEYAGTWPKRFKNWLYKTHQIKIAPDLLSKVGEIISRHAQTKEKTYYFEFAQDVEWNPGDFQEDEGSCWWESYDEARKALIAHPQGGAVLFYNSESDWQENRNECGCGRCWFWVDNGSVYIFNGYGHNLIEIARVLSTKLGTSYQKVEFSFRGSWVNGDSAYELFTDNSKGAGCIRIEIESRRECYRCDERYHEEDMYFQNGEWYCSECFNEVYSMCDRCGEICDSDDMTYIDYKGEYICRHCLNIHYTRCDGCGDRFRNDDTTHTEDDYDYCKDCLPDKTVQCEDCNNHFSYDNYLLNTTHDDRMVCDECFTKYATCPECGLTYNTEELVNHSHPLVEVE